MAFELIPFPISILFVLVFGVVVMAVLWKLRERGKAYRVLFNVSLVIGAFVLALLIIGVISTLQQGPVSINRRSPITPYPVTPAKIFYLFL
jgi:hypothetical protein